MSQTTIPASASRPRVLCVDDEPFVLAALSNTLRRRFEITTAPNGPAGLRVLTEQGPFAVVVTDFSMPEMNGAEFLAHAKAAAPDTVRVLLTGHANSDDVVAAVSDGRILRVLTKPCPPATLIRTLEECVEYRRQRMSEAAVREEPAATRS